MNKGKLQELIVALFLRLNGYFTSSLIVHHPDIGKNTTDLDVLAVRFPWHSQPDRGIGTAPELKCPDAKIDIIICEVKSVGEPLQFNSALRNSPDAVHKLLQWVGAFELKEIADLESKVSQALKQNPSKTEPATIQGPREICIRTILFSPERNKRNQSQSWFVPGPPIIDHLWQCLHPESPRSECSTQYDFGLWGAHLEPLVRFIKDTPKPATFKNLLEAFQGRLPSEKLRSSDALSP